MIVPKSHIIDVNPKENLDKMGVSIFKFSINLQRKTIFHISYDHRKKQEKTFPFSCQDPITTQSDIPHSTLCVSIN